MPGQKAERLESRGALAKLLADRTDRAHAAQALQQARLRGRNSVLKLLVPKPGETRLEAFRVLGVVGSAKSRIALAKATNDPHADCPPRRPRCGDGAAE